MLKSSLGMVYNDGFLGKIGASVRPINDWAKQIKKLAQETFVCQPSIAVHIHIKVAVVLTERTQ